MKLQIEDIKVGTRIRQEFGDLSQLKRSIQEVGLLTPVIINEQNELVSGFRRLEACRQLGWTEIEVNVINTREDQVKKLDLEYHENLGRLDLTTEEQQSYSQTRYDLLHPPKLAHPFWKWLKKIWEKIMSLFKRFQKDKKS
ncbi:MAG: ParB N-terminal domain-containing protein [bacterium]|nr:MAG: ParB N-terminal domain-containing protein [bacterium]